MDRREAMKWTGDIDFKPGKSREWELTMGFSRIRSGTTSLSIWTKMREERNEAG